MSNPSIHVASLLKGEEVYGSALTRLTADSFPILSGLSIKRLTLAPGAIREPHWHADSPAHLLRSTDAGDIGYRASMSAYSRQVLAAPFGVALDELPDLPFTPADPLIVTRNNPVDPQHTRSADLIVG
jgi:hypothetical protein